jgi:hypothetical protein
LNAKKRNSNHGDSDLELNFGNDKVKKRSFDSKNIYFQRVQVLSNSVEAQQLINKPQPEMAFSSLAEVRQIPTQQAHQRKRVHSLLGPHPNPNPHLGVPRNPNPLLVGLNLELNRHFSVLEVGLQLVQPPILNLPNNLSHLIYLLLEEVLVGLPIQILHSLLKVECSNLVLHQAHQVLVQHLSPLGAHFNPNPLLGVPHNPNPLLLGLNLQLKRQLPVSSSKNLLKMK